MNRVSQLLRFLWDFVVGDDWRIAAAVVIAVAVTALIGRAGWFVLPVVVVLVLGHSVHAAAARTRGVKER